MSATLRIGEGLQLPLGAVTQTFGLVGKRGVGKTHGAGVLAEELLENGAQVVVLDPIGVWWGLRSSSDGKGDGYPVLIIGGDHGDLPLEASSGKLIASFVVSKRASVVLDMGELSKADQARFVTDFLEHVYRTNRSPLHLVIDEADAFAPQRLHPGIQRCFGAVDQVVRRGRARGLGVTLVTQRSAAINKDVLTQIEVLVAFRTIAPQDRAAIEAWVEVHADDPKTVAEVLRTLATLEVGEAWIWSPAWLSLLKRVRIRKRKTFDSSATPEMGRTVKAPKAIAAIDVDAFRTELAALVEKADHEDPRRLQRRIAELERELAAKPAPKLQRVEVPAITEKDLARLETVLTRIGKAEGALEELAVELRKTGDKLNTVLRPPAVASTPNRPACVAAMLMPAPRPATVNGTANGHAASTLKKAERSILKALIQVGPSTAARIALIAGYAATGGGFLNALGSLRVLGLIEGANTGVISVTANGSTAIGPVEPLPSGDELVRYWLTHPSLKKAERAVLEIISRAGDRGLGADAIAETAGYAVAGGGFLNALGKLRTLGLLEGRNTETMRLSRHLLEIA